MPQDFDYRTASREKIAERARPLEGRSIAGIAAETHLAIDLTAATKGTVGAVIEAYFGIEPNSRPEADFTKAHVELKSVPLVGRADGTFRTKERTVVTMIDYVRLAAEDWSGASVRSKLNAILFIFYRWDPEIGGPSVIVDRVLMWEPTSEELELFQHDWTVVWEKVVAGVAEDISESDGRALGASTKGANSRSLRRQPNSDVLAMQRAWALKPSFTQALYEAQSAAVRTVTAVIDLDEFERFEASVMDRLDSIRGRSIQQVADLLGIRASSAKDFHARVVSRAIGATRRKREPDEFARFGIENKITRVSPNGRPYEAMSFPAFDYFDISDEIWEDSDLLRRIERMLIVPLVAAEKSTPLAEARVGRAFYWTPDIEQLEGIRREWDMYRREIAEGRAHRLTPASRTRYIHVRPHGRVRADTRDAPGIGPVTKKAFWLNIAFLEELVAYSGRDGV